MRCFLGRELVIGATVIVAVGHGRNAGADLAMGKVTGFTPQRVRVARQRGTATIERLVHPSKVAVI